MLALLAAITTTTYIACTNCQATGSITLKCPECQGKGRVTIELTSSKHATAYNLGDQSKPCPKCTKGLANKKSKGTGTIKRQCPVCKGRKKIKPKITKPVEAATNKGN